MLGRFTQVLPNNWKLYVENVKDTYHASLLHLFFTTFRINRLSQGGGMLVSRTAATTPATRYDRRRRASEHDLRGQGIRSDNEDFALDDPSLLDSRRRVRRRHPLQILTVFPSFVLQQIHNAIAVRQIVPHGPDADGAELDLPRLRRRHAGDASAAAEAGQPGRARPATSRWRTAASAASCSAASPTAGDERAVVEMGGEGTGAQDTRATEASVRGFWKGYRGHMGV